MNPLDKFWLCIGTLQIIAFILGMLFERNFEVTYEREEDEE